MMRRGYTFLRSGRLGPVMLQLPGDVANEQIDEAAIQYKPVNGVKSAGDPSDIAEAVKILLSSKNPVIYAGQGILWAEASDELIEFAELTNTPVMTTNTG